MFFLRCAATSSSHSGLSYLWTTISLKKTWLKREIVLLLTFSRSWVQCFISYNPTMPSLAMHHRAEETFTLSWLLMRSTALPRWTKVTDEPGWTTWQSGAGMDWMEKHQGSTQAPRFPESFSWCASLKLINRNMNGHHGIHLYLKFIHPPASWCRTPLTSHRCYADFFSFTFKSMTTPVTISQSVWTWTQIHDSETKLQIITFYFTKY